MIIGITGTLGAGKGTLTNYLVKKKHFKHFSVSELITQHLIKKGLEINRDNMVLVANELRKKYGPSYLVEVLYKKAKNIKGNCVIESIRTEGEITSLKKHGDFYLFSIDANRKIRFNRILKRASLKDKISYHKFILDEKKEMTSIDPTKINLSKCMELADYHFNNDGTAYKLYKEIEKTLNEIKNSKKIVKKNNIQKNKYVRPSWDDYFLEIMNTVSKRATCDRGRSGCVIQKDNQLLATGYVGSPKGLSHCDDVGHEIRKILHEDGSISLHCVRTVHAEQNAIIQAAKRGIALDGSTLYCRMTPCRTCAMFIINAGIKRVVCEKKYHAGIDAEKMFKKVGIKLHFKHNDLIEYPNMLIKNK